MYIDKCTLTCACARTHAHIRTYARMQAHLFIIDIAYIYYQGHIFPCQ